MGKFKSISTKILISYLAAVVLTFLITALAFYPILVGVLERRAEIGLEKQAWEIAYTIRRHQSGQLPPDELNLPLTILLLGRSVESDYLWLNSNDTIILSSRPEQFPPGRSLSALPDKLREVEPYDPSLANIYKTEEYVAVEVPVASGDGQTVLTFVPIRTLHVMYRETLFSILASLFGALIIALFIAYFLIRYLVKPLKNLEDYAQAIGDRKFDVRLEVKSDDELSKLAVAFNQMADRLKSYDEGMRRFFQNASHEMKTPLMSINGYAEGIRDGVFTGSAMEDAIDIIHKESLRLRNVVENMIDITILEQPHHNYSLPQDLYYIVEEVIDTVGGYALDRKVEIVSKIQPNILIIGDWEQLHSLFVNLLSNGIRYARSQVLIQSKIITEGTKVLIKVQDDGEGFTAEDLEHAFDYFYTGANGGSGLGLTIVQKIVTEHTGNISIYNTVQGGAVVELVFPVVKKVYDL